MNARRLIVYLTLLCIALSLLGWFLLVERQTAGVIGAPLDDAWIHFQYARNLSQGHGFSYNPGEPTPGSTAPLWTLLLALPALFTDALMTPALALSASFYALTLWLTQRFVADMAKSDAVGWLAAVGVAVTGRMVWAALSGMEATAFAALSVAAVWAVTRHGWRWWVALLFGLAAQLRPEGHALFGLALALSAVQWAQTTPRPALPWRAWALAVGIYAATAAPYALFSLSTTGLPLPNTFYAKSDSAVLFSVRALRETVALHWQDNPASVLLLPLGVALLWRRSRLAAVWLVALPLLTALIVDGVWHHGRYTLPLVPFQMAAAVLGGQWLWRRVRRRLPGRGRRWALLVGVGLFVAAGAWRLPYWATMLGQNVREIEEIDVALGRWLADNTPPDALIAVDDIGAIGYLSQRRLFDLHGLISPEVWPILRAEPQGRPRNEALARLLSHVEPDYLAVFPVWRFELATNRLVATPLTTVRTGTHTMILEQEATVYAFTPPYVDSAESIPTTPLDATFADAVRLLGLDSGRDGDTLDLTLYWQSVAPLDVRYDVFVHLLDAEGNIVAQTDREPVGGLAPTTRWQPGDVVRDPLTLALPPDLAPGAYQVTAGFFWRDGGGRLPVAGAAAISADTVRLLTVNVE